DRNEDNKYPDDELESPHRDDSLHWLLHSFPSGRPRADGVTEGPRAMGHRPKAGGSLSRREGFGHAVGWRGAAGPLGGNSVCSAPPKRKSRRHLWLNSTRKTGKSWTSASSPT